ncbi:hypothetical protein JZ751_020170 [Albula glossodonta]|uniref:Calcium binding protein 39 n=1 Tax=Albula glossodonta TaxID=121402 RepID=A0A8T2NMW2_9TELE|nr:hypothetical protein JZ751_020170 [Albula glossodonta]
MPFPFGKSQKSPADMVKSLKENVANLEKLDASESKKCEKGKKDVVQLFSNIVRRQIGTRTPTVEYISSHTQILFMLLKGYENAEVALNCGMMLRECLRHEPLARTVLFSEEFFCFFRYVELSTFDIASDAFASFKLLLDRHNFTVMTRYISRAENLKLMMNLLKDNSRNIQFEAFHVFKVFVANPNKTQPVLDILLKNQTKLVEFLSHFQNDRSEDEQFCDEKNYLIKQIRDLKKPTVQGEA